VSVCTSVCRLFLKRPLITLFKPYLVLIYNCYYTIDAIPEFDVQRIVGQCDVVIGVNVVYYIFFK